MRNGIFLLSVFFLLLKGYGQNTIALPEITNYTKQQYNAGTQNWKIRQDARGIFYFANNEGLLTFDGTFWKKYILPNETIVRSLAIGKDQRIYIGAQSEIGYFAPDKNGILKYTSLTHLIPSQQKDFADVWEVLPVEDQVFFRSNKKIFQLNNGKIKVYTSIDWNFLGYSNGRLIAKEYSKGLLTFKNGLWTPFLQKGELPKGARVTSLISINKDSSLLSTLKHGLFIIAHNELTPFRSTYIESIANRNIYSTTMIAEDKIAVATNLAGCFIINKKGELIQRLSKQDGLQNNNVLNVYMDRNKNLWLGLDNGIDFVDYNKAIKRIFPDYQEHSAGYTSIIFKNQLFVGTSYGLYKAPLSDSKDLSFVKSDFSLVPNSKGQVWNLSEVNNDLLMGHNEGAFIVKDQGATALDSTSGFWSFMPLQDIVPSPVIMAGTYNGLNFYRYENGRYINTFIHSHFESARFIGIDNNTAWIAHPYKGLYKVQLNNGQRPSYTVYTDKNKILSANRNYIYKVKSRIILSTDKGLFEYNSQTDDFEPSTFLRKIFGSKTVQYLKEDEKGSIWFIENKRPGVVDFSGTTPKITYLPELNNKVMANGYEFIYPYNNNNVFIAGEQGFFHINYELYKSHKEATPLLISSVKVINGKDSTIFGGYFENSQHLINKEVPNISYSWNSIHFEYASQVYGQQSGVEYSYYLEDFDKGWSEWTKKSEKDYTYLSPGTYTFKVKARTHEGNESAVCSYRFTILPPWYRTTWAYLFYFLLFSGLAYSGYKWQKQKFIRQQQRHEEEQNRLQYLHQLELERSENEIIRLRNEKLEAEVQLKNTELASTTMNLLKKGEMLNKVKEEFVKLKKGETKETSSEDYKKIMRMLEDDTVKKDWNQFAIHFDKVHSDFLISLKNSYPNLTPSELKLCAYLRLNLSSKEIAQIMNITIKSVELSRYRLRKKLQIPSEINLFNFLLNFHSGIKEQ